jgi:hypothetical protein
LQEKSVSGELPEVLLEKLILAGQSLLTIIADLKRAALLSDFPGLNQLIKSKIDGHDGLRLDTERRMQQITIVKDTQVNLVAQCRKRTIASSLQ